jgi:Mce-associated membrane protein
MMPTPPPPPRPAGRAPLFVLVAVAVLLAGAAVGLFVAAGSTAEDADRLAAQAERTQRAADRLSEDVDTANRALTDTEITTAVTDQLRTAVELTFSYDHADLDATARAVDRYLTGEARCVYDQVFAQVKALAPAQRIVLRTTVREIALARLSGEEAEALVFIDQSSSRGDTGNSVAAQAQFTVYARLDGDTWQLTRLDFFDQPMVGGGPPPDC